MSRKIDTVGKKYGRLTILKEIKSSKTKNSNRLKCRCDCGNEKEISRIHVLSGHTISCGCFKIEQQTKHKQTGTKLYHVWSTIIQRCSNQNNSKYYMYGARGIFVCGAWQEFKSFYDWALENGYKEDLTIDRIDNNGPYSPENCRWTTRKEQSRNTRSNHLLTFNGETHSIAKWAELVNLPYQTLYCRVDRNWSIERALTQGTSYFYQTS